MNKNIIEVLNNDATRSLILIVTSMICITLVVCFCIISLLYNKNTLLHECIKNRTSPEECAIIWEKIK